MPRREKTRLLLLGNNKGADTSMQSDHRLCSSLIGKYTMQNFNILTSVCS